MAMRNLRRLKVFISYARNDGVAVAQRLQADLGAQGFDAWLDTQRLAPGRGLSFLVLVEVMKAAL
jgi:hypothetical protein